MLDLFKIHIWFTISNYVSLPVNLAENHIKDIYERTINPKKETPVLSQQFQKALEFYVKAKQFIPDL